MFIDKETTHICPGIIKSKMGDLEYRYGKQQLGYGVFDPTSLSEDISNDAMKAGAYGIKNLKYILCNFNTWLNDKETTHICPF